MKTITISDEVYRKLASIKGDKTFSQIIDELIMRDVNKRVEKIIEVATRKSEGVEELEEIVKNIRRTFKVRY
ncbi:MAG: antitoxin [Thermofilum sp. ex4484_82]|nr:MAG: antitoxin [Thermofilum sp. ex4484_82]OYT35747.1 MAG: antitoxin [Archaeoglobales archaeon ex4484_92]RLE28398.1 MAG: antitoxin [Candidatus Acetothermia bacterium]RLE83609.1 MAG: antitoxin [Thermoprotei archaeon]